MEEYNIIVEKNEIVHIFDFDKNRFITKFSASIDNETVSYSSFIRDKINTKFGVDFKVGNGHYIGKKVISIYFNCSCVRPVRFKAQAYLKEVKRNKDTTFFLKREQDIECDCGKYMI
jgi:hypothetical protein